MRHCNANHIITLRKSSTSRFQKSRSIGSCKPKKCDTVLWHNFILDMRSDIYLFKWQKINNLPSSYSASCFPIFVTESLDIYSWTKNYIIYTSYFNGGNVMMKKLQFIWSWWSYDQFSKFLDVFLMRPMKNLIWYTTVYEEVIAAFTRVLK